MNEGVGPDAKPGSGSIRAFVAVPVEEPQFAALLRVQQRLQAGLRKDMVQWPGIDQLHLTLRFLGNVPGSQVPQLNEALQIACGHTKAFRLTLDGLGCFPNDAAPRVIWVGIQGDVETLHQLQQRIEQCTGSFGDHTEDRAFHPHLTIGRVKIRGRQARLVGELIAPANAPQSTDWPVRDIELIQSVLTPRGAKYSRLATVSLES